MKTLDTRQTNRRNLIVLVMFMFLLAAAFGPASGVAQTPPKEERAVEDRVPKHLPVKVKVKNEQSLKDLKNKKWARELEVEVKNTGSKPIYFVNVEVVMPDIDVQGAKLVMIAAYGRWQLAVPDAPVTQDDVPILPGETVTLKIPESQAKAFEEARDEEHKWDDPKKVRIEIQIINFGDGTFMLGKEGTLRNAVPKPRSSNDARPKGEELGCKASVERDDGGLFVGVLEAFSFKPASLLRANFFFHRMNLWCPLRRLGVIFAVARACPTVCGECWTTPSARAITTSNLHPSLPPAAAPPTAFVIALRSGACPVPRNTMGRKPVHTTSQWVAAA
jgi:hypothetical protein